VEAGPLVRSSYHAKRAAQDPTGVTKPAQSWSDDAGSLVGSV
jgi:hypothetical protein